MVLTPQQPELPVEKGRQLPDEVGWGSRVDKFGAVDESGPIHGNSRTGECGRERHGEGGQAQARGGECGEAVYVGSAVTEPGKEAFGAADGA